MPTVLEPAIYTRVHSLFEEMQYHLAVMTVLTGITPGKIYVDDPATPRAAILIPSNQHRIYVVGSAEQTVLNEALHTLFTQSLVEQETEYYEFLVYYASDNWKHALDQLLKGQETFSGWRQFYRLREPSLQGSVPLPEGISICRMDETLLIDRTLKNRERLLEEMCAESPSLEHFFHHNFGFSAQDDHTLVGWCLAEYHYQDRYELGIETVEAYQRKGIATRVASATIEHAFAQGATEIGWHCWATNTASVATARRIGFEKVIDYPVYYCRQRQQSDILYSKP